jgi:PAS domain S-box-containing protein
VTAAALPADEAQRLARLRALTVLDSAPEPLFDSFARLAAQIAGTPIALVSLIDEQRQWFKANLGLPGVQQTPRDMAFCAHAILSHDMMEVPNAQLDPRFADNPLVTGEPGIRFYAGTPLTLPSGERLGTLCVIDRAPRQLSAAQRTQLAELAQGVVQALLLRERALGNALGTPSAVESELAGHVRALSAILDRLPLSVSVWDRQLRNAYANARMQQRFGRNASSLLGAHLPDVIGAAAYEANDAQRQAVFAGQAQSFEARVARNDGVRDEHVQLVPLRGEEGNVEGYVALVQDLWDQRAMDAAQRALADSERKFRTLSDASPLGVFHTNAKGHCTYTNARWQTIFGLSLERSLGEGWSSTLHPDDRAHVFDEWQRSAAAGVEFAMEFRVQRPDTSMRYVRAMARALIGEDGTVTGFVGTVEDVSEARARQARLLDSEAFLDRTGRIAGIGGWEVHLIDNTLTWSDQTCRIHDLEPGHQPTVEEAISYYAPEVRETIAHAFELAITVGTPYDLELPMVTAQGRHIWVRTLGEVTFEQGRAARVFGTFQDITWRHDAEIALRDSNRLLRQLYEQTPAMMHSIGVDGLILSVSDRWLESMGYRREEVIGRRAIELFTDESRRVRQNDLQQLWASGHHTSGVLQVRRSDGSLLDIVASAIVQYDEGGQALRALVVTDDVTELLARTAELRREQVQRADVERYAAELDALLAERSEMLNVLAHEVRQPLNNASAALQSAAAALASPRSRDDAAERLQRAQGVMQAVMSGVDNTLAVAALLGGGQAPTRQDNDVDIDTLLAVAVGDMPLGERERVHIERVADTRTASMDMGLLRLALRNLLANALRYSPPGSPVTLRVADSDQPLALVLDVIDRGPGIQPELLPRLFERGTRGRHPSGRASHGLGLYIVRRVLELQGGRAELVATSNEGTTMRLWIAQGDGELPPTGERKGVPKPPSPPPGDASTTRQGLA